MTVSTIIHARYALSTRSLSQARSQRRRHNCGCVHDTRPGTKVAALQLATPVSIVQAWKQYGGEVIPRVSFTDIERGLSNAQKDHIKKSGVVVVTGAVPKEEALRWKVSLKEYITANPVKAPQFWHDPSNKRVSFSTPISYLDRLRIRTPGDSSFTLDPHIDGGSIERWEDPTFRRVFRRILAGGRDLYNAPGQCSVLRCWQGWTSLSTTGVGEGTLRVLPMLSLATAYIMLRPFFRPSGPSGGEWELDLESSLFPGSIPGKGQELNEETHPHLKLGETMTSIPEIQPGDQVYWHCDTVHSVEKLHGGQKDSSVFYIPAVPLTVKNASYIRDQRINFVHGLPAPDFPGGSGESTFAGRATAQDVTTSQGRRALGFEPFLSEGIENNELVNAANRVLFG
ncbi:uncharacterized protein EDB93DRAFT_1120013 [Suillus bovinus]|uniref:uncharacterized protein n=1 Tax=Suillus bovinus TaxID=48563 RepID=UPI001B865E01|nr:uncharacterized protein EDB93DRAFT_1120013 [Suillus bovinus]KAG2158747.1 hypothetical protein EDB93DRAFT_1120013 [Suillus bovinus]